jgi:hypothetical protein
MGRQQRAAADQTGGDDLAHQFEPAERLRGHVRDMGLRQAGMMDDWPNASTGYVDQSGNAM